jgi:hypothetical protein
MCSRKEGLLIEKAFVVLVVLHLQVALESVAVAQEVQITI